MSDFRTIQDWNDLIDGLMLDGRSTAVGVFDFHGHLLDANHAMSYFLDIDPNEKSPRNSFVNPEFSVFAENPNSGQIFEGIQTIGDRLNVSYSLAAKVFRKENTILVFAEADVQQLFTDNKKMSQLNQEVNNLQRQLIREKMNLQQTLKELKETQQMLVHSEKMNAMGKLVAGVAHEINNPISFVYSNVFSLEKYISEIVTAYSELETLTKSSGQAEIVNQISEIRKKNDLDFLIDDIADISAQSKNGLERVKTIVEDLRKFSRLDEAEMKQIDLIENIRSTMGIAGIEFSTRNIKVQLVVPEVLMLECFPGQLNQAILNVLINAAQAIDSNGEIIVSVMESGSDVQISVEDNGCGIPENIQEKIFDPFFTTKPVGSGTGLGLSITYKIITGLHHGKISVISKLGKGSIFNLSIPKSQEKTINKS